DRADADALASRDGPERILRADEEKVARQGNGIDARLPAWNPPLANIALLCHYEAMRTTNRWQALRRAPNRCGQPRLMRSVSTAYGRTVPVPRGPRGDLIYAKVHGAGISGLERIQTFFFRSSVRYATVNHANY